ncbi:hypothetical protein [Ferruginibacter sp. SUN106]|uniref:hypothetical protein n=1 Tax=Ferruginibacter sp. SUN106 TaxID=2978348 RepID=UPI003D365077
MITQRNAAQLFVLMIVSVFIFTSCKKSSNTDTNGNTETFPAQISNIAPKSMIDSLRAVGVNVYSGTTPPLVNGIYLMTPDSCTYDNSPGNFAGTIFTDYKFRFSAQDNAAFTIMVEQKAMPAGTLSSTPVSTYISGSGNKFSIFLLRTITPSGITVQQFNVLSGTLTASGIQNLQNTLYVRSKGSDPGNIYPPAGTIRLFVTGRSGLAANSTTF